MPAHPALEGALLLLRSLKGRSHPQVVVKDLSQLMIQSNQPIDYLINSNHVTSIGTLNQYQIKPVLASEKCLRALLWLLLLNNCYGLLRLLRSVASQHL